MLKAALNPRQMRARHAIARLCASGLSSLDLFRHVAPHVRAAMPYACSGWLGTDPATLLCTTCYVENIRHEDCVRLKDNELFTRDFAKFDHLARSGRNAASLLAETDGHLDLSPRYRDTYDRLGVQDELRMVFRGADAILGIGCVVRIADAPPFTHADLTFVDAIADLVGEGLRRSLLLDHAGPDGANGMDGTTGANGTERIVDHDRRHAPGLIVLRADNSIESMTAEARALLDEMTTDVGIHHELPTVIYHLAHAARRAGQVAARDADLRLHPPARIRLPSGRWLIAHASLLAGPGDDLDRIAIVLQPARRAQLAPLLVELYGLTDREREVTALLVRGLAVKDIARTLSISFYTVRDHVKVIFAKLSVTSRPQLTAKLFFEHFAPHVVTVRGEGTAGARE